MKSEALAYFPMKELTAVGLLIFVALFVGVLFWVNRKASKRVYEYLGNLPLEKE